MARANLWRNTLHLVTAPDCLALHPLTAPLRIRGFRSPFGAALKGADPEAVAEAARALIVEAPRTRTELSARLAERWPEADPLALAYVATHYLPLVQLPPRGLWGGRGMPTYALADAWLGAPLDEAAGLAPFVRRYLAAFGPATPADVRTWAGVAGLRPVIDALRPELRTFRDEHGRELLDVPDAPIADPHAGATALPPRVRQRHARPRRPLAHRRAGRAGHRRAGAARRRTRPGELARRGRRARRRRVHAGPGRARGDRGRGRRAAAPPHEVSEPRVRFAAERVPPGQRDAGADQSGQAPAQTTATGRRRYRHRTAHGVAGRDPRDHGHDGRRERLGHRAGRRDRVEQRRADHVGRCEQQPGQDEQHAEQPRVRPPRAPSSRPPGRA